MVWEGVPEFSHDRRWLAVGATVGLAFSPDDKRVASVETWQGLGLGKTWLILWDTAT